MIWGFAFVAQRAGMEFVGPFTFNAIRFALGGFSLLPFLILNKKRKLNFQNFSVFKNKYFIYGGIIAGIILFLGSTFQQTGIVYTTAGKAGFITGLYIIFVPLFGLFLKNKTPAGTWIGAVIAVMGLYFLSVTESFSMGLGDLLVLVSGFFWAAHVLLIGKISPKTDPIQLAFLQFIICSFLSLIAALISETSTINNIYNASIPILYTGICSVGIAYTLQVVAQREAHPAHAAIIMSLEAVFALIGGVLILDETIPLRGLIGCGLMLAGVIVSQLYLLTKNKTKILISN
ncbi:MAG: EamA family transporter [Ignavibacteriae bacterium]|nr:MAG: EamA family transporter [Ignavibacteriota bacterium]